MSLPALTLESAYEHLKKVNFTMCNLDVAGAKKKHGDALLWCNLGNPQGVGQKPITYNREVMAAVTLPSLIESEAISKTARARAAEINDCLPGHSSGAYPPTAGASVIREQIAEFITARDGFKAESGDVFMANGATEAVQNLMRLLVKQDGDSIMVPCPHFPLYTGYLQYIGATYASYQLDETKAWDVQEAELHRVYNEAIEQGHPPRGIVVINPNNPTGSVLSKESLTVLCRFAHAHGLPLVADEVYQRNIFEPEQRPFIAVLKIAQELAAQGECEGLQVISLHSASKGLSAECGRRGGYMHFHNIDKKLVSAFDDILSMGCPNIEGMVAMSAIVNPPREGDDAYDKYQEECGSLLSALVRKAKMVAEAFNSWEGMSCVQPAGAMYAYPKIEVPPKAVAAAAAEGIEGDALYVNELLDTVGVVVLPGSVFGQMPNTHHLRMTILPDEKELAVVLEKWAVFHKEFMAKYQ
ncbi:hypothetical protein KIPB_007483 [Kipferlia bialata]|uniref:Aminotransferase class I/classII large domain-containing protein n=1 Tax=Kipferlia bialata TaxID=797122 RepID=A0A391NMK1_9EUKA|nr:hypothetical protein KIPB_007483 [Kipferlia bialata]|eukprot:g7483.t1